MLEKEDFVYFLLILTQVMMSKVMFQLNVSEPGRMTLMEIVYHIFKYHHV